MADDAALAGGELRLRLLPGSERRRALRLDSDTGNGTWRLSYSPTGGERIGGALERHQRWNELDLRHGGSGWRQRAVPSSRPEQPGPAGLARPERPIHRGGTILERGGDRRCRAPVVR